MGDSWRPIYWKDRDDEFMCIGQIHVETGEISPPWHFAPAKGAAMIPDDVRTEANKPEHTRMPGGFTHWSSGLGNYTFDSWCLRCWWDKADALQARVKALEAAP